MAQIIPLDRPSARAPSSFGRRLAKAAVWVDRAMRIHRERRRLIALDACALKDIGLSRADAYGEWSRPFWDLPRRP
jgi:uncharacterized protein YjiS (DUF1127 family)